MYAPANTTVILEIQSTDVIHSWWVPSLGGKVDAVPGYTTYTWFKAPQGRAPCFHGQCAQLCGRSHAAMTALVQVLSPADYKAWLTRQSDLITQANAQVTQLRADPQRQRKPLAGETSSEMSVTSEPATSQRVDRPVPQVTTHEVTRPRTTKRWIDWVTTTDHKKIGILYLVTTFVFFALGGIEALLMRAPARRSRTTRCCRASTTTSC